MCSAVVDLSPTHKHLSHCKDLACGKETSLYVLSRLNISCAFTLSLCLALIIQDVQGGDSKPTVSDNGTLGCQVTGAEL